MTQPNVSRKALVATVAARLRVKPKEIDQVCEALLNAIAGAISAGRKVTIQPLGVFCVKNRAARQGRNPATGAMVMIPAKTVAKWKPGIAVKRALGR